MALVEEKSGPYTNPDRTHVRPLLSICVPTYNRAHLLRTMLQAALPQIKEWEGLVECWVSDNGSSDNTAEVVESSRSLGPVNYSRNDENRGFHGNVVKLVTELAQGEYLWLIGDDDLLLPEAISRLIPILEANRDRDGFYVNFRVASHRSHWPESALAGYGGEYRHLSVPDRENHPVDTWHQFLASESYLCTHMYANITRRQSWVDYWRGRKVPPPAQRTLLSVYPHNVVFGEMLMYKPAYYIGDPMLTMFDGAQSFSADMSWYQAIYYPRVLRYYHKKGLHGNQLRRCVHGVFSDTVWPHLVNVLRNRKIPSSKAIAQYFVAAWRYPVAWRVLASAIRVADRPRILSVLVGGLSKVRRMFAG